jgi:hypothetical protein
MGNVVQMDQNELNPDEIEKEALKEVMAGRREEAKDLLIKKFEELNDARQIVSNLEREIGDLKVRISEGNF